jgi:hypothetical protein
MNQFDLNSWLSSAIHYFRVFGFFATYHGSDDEFGETIKSHWHGDWDEYLAAVSARPSADQLLLIADTQRVWWHDLEGVYRGANYYASVLSEWAIISQGRFTPEQIQESWQGDNGPVEVSFALNSNQYIFVHRSGDFLDHKLLQLVNRALANTAVHFEVATDFGDSNWITMLDQAEKKRLQTERGWHFLW